MHLRSVILGVWGSLENSRVENLIFKNKSNSKIKTGEYQHHQMLVTYIYIGYGHVSLI